MAQLKYSQKLDFEGYPINNLKYPNKKNSFSISKSIEFQYMAQLKYGKDCCERQKSTSFGEELFIRIILYCLPSQELFLTHVTAPHNRTESVICLHLLYICPITCICFQHLPYISSIHYSD